MHPVSRGQHLTDEELRERMQIGEGAQSLSKITANNGQCFIFELNCSEFLVPSCCIVYILPVVELR